jgi:hypothetical protein
MDLAQACISIRAFCHLIQLSQLPSMLIKSIIKLAVVVAIIIAAFLAVAIYMPFAGPY